MSQCQLSNEPIGKPGGVRCHSVNETSCPFGIAAMEKKHGSCCVIYTGHSRFLQVLGQAGGLS
jgi:hypothetical protein